MQSRSKTPARIDPKSLTPEAREQRKAVLEQKKELTSRISETTRTLAFGSLASCYALLFAEQSLAALFTPYKSLLLWSAGLGVATIITDAAQYTFGYINTQQALRRQSQTFPENWSRNGRGICFVLKQILAYGAALLLLVAVTSAIF